MTDQPLPFRWLGDGFVPLNPFWAKRADQQYVVGAVYTMAAVEERSDRTHKHEFAWLREAWLNLPERLADAYPTSEHLRKRALIEAGYCDEELINCSTSAAALRVAASFRKHNDFALVIVRGPVVVIRTAKSQSRRAMDRATFNASKAAILEIVSVMIGTTPEALERQMA